MIRAGLGRRVAVIAGLVAWACARAPAESGAPPTPLVTAPADEGALLATSLPDYVLAQGHYTRWERSTPPTRVLVVAHSFTDRTHLVAQEAARMLGADYLRLYQAPGDEEFSEGAPPLSGARLREDAASIEQAVQALSGAEFEVVLLGSPIWGEATPLIRSVAEAAQLSGKLVVPFVTHAQQFDVAKLEAYLARLRERGARVARPWVLRLPLNLSEHEIRRLVWRSLPARVDLWWGREALGSARCGQGEAGLDVCAVPAGVAWIWPPVPAREGGTLYKRAPRLVSVPSFEMERAEVSVARYGGGRSPREAPLTRVWNTTCAELVGDRLDVAMPCVSFDEAKAWCQARGLRLPSLAEWTRAARGDRATPYPWGAHVAFDGLHGNFGEAAGSEPLQGACNRAGVAFRSDGFGGLAPPCSFPAGASSFGVCDLAGNVAEWVLSDPAQGGAGAALAGGSWFDCEPEAWRVDRPAWWPTGVTFDGIGFRCVR